MTLAQWWSFAMVAYGVFGLYLAGNKKVAGWWVGLSAQVLWVGFAAVTGLWPFYISAFAYGWVNVRNLLRWHRERRVGYLPDGELTATCPTCSKPDPATVAAVREITATEGTTER